MQQNNTLPEIKQKARLDKFRGVFFMAYFLAGRNLRKRAALKFEQCTWGMSKSAQKLFCNAQNRAGVKRKIKIQVVELKYSRVMENKFLGIRASQKSSTIKKFVWHVLCFLLPNARAQKKHFALYA